MNDQVLSAADRRRSLVAVIASMAVTSLIYGLTTPLLALILENQGVDATLIGLNTGAQTVAIFVIVPYASRVVGAMGPARLMLWSVAATLAVFLLLPVYVNVYAWFPLRFLMGCAGSLMWVAGETWINQIAGEGSRGRVVAVYATALSAGFALGPLVLAETGIDGLTPFLVAAALIALSGAPLLIATSAAPLIGGRPMLRLSGYVRHAPTAMLGNLALAAASGISLTFLPIYGMRMGLAPDTALFLIIASGVGSIALQLPIGWLADMIDRRALMAMITVFALAGAAMLPFVVTATPLNWLYMFVFGGIRGGLYTVALVLVGERFRGPDLAAATAAFTAVWGLGGIAGPPLGGFALAHWDPHGVPAMLALIFLVYLPFPLLDWLRGRCAKP